MALNKTLSFDLELKPGGIPPIIHASQGDIGRMFKANIYWDGSAATSYVSGATVNLRGKKPDKTVFDYTATLAGSMVTFETTEQMTIISGPVECELVFSNDGDVIASANFVLIVEESPWNPDAMSESEIEGLTDLLAGFQRLNRDANGVVKIGDDVTASGALNNTIDGFFVHDEEKNTNGVEKLSINGVSNLDTELYNNPFVTKSFVIKGGTSHSSTADKLTVDIKTGEKFAVIASAGTIILWYSDGTNLSLGNALNYKGVAQKNITSIGIYHGTIWDDTTVYFTVAKNPWSSDILNTIDIVSALNTGGGLFQEAISGAIDADSLNKTLTIYSFGTSETVSNIPESVTVGLIFNVTGNSATARKFQFLFDSLTNTMYYRTKLGGVWASWVKVGTPQIILSKTATDKFTISVPEENGQAVRYDFQKCSKTWATLEYTDGNGQTQTANNIVSSNYWNNYYVYNGETGDYIAQGNSNFIVKVDDSVLKYVGNGHGNEVLLSLDVIADGAKVDIEQLAVGSVVKCSCLRLVERSNIYAPGGSGSSNSYSDSFPKLDTSGNPIINFFHYMELKYEIGNKITIDNRLTVKQNNLTFKECHGAMLECQFEDFTAVITNNAENTQNTVDDSGVFTVSNGSSINLANKAQYADTVEMFGGRFYIRQSMEVETPVSNNAVVYFNKYTDRLKCYFQPVATGDRNITGATPATFNNGDVIAVKDVRQIDI